MLSAFELEIDMNRLNTISIFFRIILFFLVITLLIIIKLIIVNLNFLKKSVDFG